MSWLPRIGSVQLQRVNLSLVCQGALDSPPGQTDVICVQFIHSQRVVQCLVSKGLARHVTLHGIRDLTIPDWALLTKSNSDPGSMLRGLLLTHARGEYGLL